MKRAGRFERRTLLKGLAAGFAGTVASPIAPAAAAQVAATPAATAAPPAPSLPRFLDDHQRGTLTSLAGILVPGSVEAGVVDLIDRATAVDAPPRQRQLLNALGRFDGEARAAGGDRWIDLDQPARLAILLQASEATPAASHFVHLRTLVANAYLATEAGMKDFGWTGRAAWKELPACTHPDPAHE